MNREILFRGRGYTGEFVSGSLVHYPTKVEFKAGQRTIGDREVTVDIILHVNGDGSALIADAVYSDTVGQYVWAHDKNGKMIFEGDVLLSRYDLDYPDDSVLELVCFYRGQFCLIELDGFDAVSPDMYLFDYPNLDEYVGDAPEIRDEDTSEYSTVIGNVHQDLTMIRELVAESIQRRQEYHD